MQTTTEQLLTKLRHMQKSLPGKASSWVNDFRGTGLSDFAATGLPNHKTEAWKYTRLKSFNLEDYCRFPAIPTNNNEIIAPFLFAGLSKYNLVFVNGVYQPDPSTIDAYPKGVIIEPLDNALQKHPDLVHRYMGQSIPNSAAAFTEINSGLIGNGLFILIPDNIVLDSPINILLLNTHEDSTFSVHPRLLITASKNSQAEIIVQEATTSNKVQVLNNAVTEIILDAGSNIKYCKVQNHLNADLHLSASYIKQARDTHFESHTVSCGGQLIRNDLHVQLAESGASCKLNGIYVANEKQHIDNHTTIEHIAPHCDSQEFYKGLVMDDARAVFNGRVHIHPNAQKTSADLQNRNLLLSKLAEVDTKPELEIYADDVQCQHGATVGELDPRQLFLLQSRGLNKNKAKSVLSLAFINEILERLPYPEIKQQTQNLMALKLKETT